MEITEEIQKFLLSEAKKYFIKYVKIWSTSKEDVDDFPSTKIQIEFGKEIVEDLKDLGINKIEHDKFGYIYADIPATKGYEKVPEIGFIAHLDTSFMVNGKDVNPIIHENYDGKDITYENAEDLVLSIKDSPELANYTGLDIITSDGTTLLGADDKAGIAEIIAAFSAWKKYPELVHGPIKICFFPDEELGHGTDHIDIKKLPEFCYTLDGSQMGELEYECFDAWQIDLRFKGMNVHPGYAKNLMINAIHIAARFFSDLPEQESPTNTEEKEGFYHLMRLNGTPAEATARFIVRDFDKDINKRRIEYIKSLIETYKIRYPGLMIEFDSDYQYKNMYEYLEDNETVLDLAKKAIEMAGLELKIHSIRGGTDGAKLSEMGIPTPNIFTGGQLFHSLKEYIPTIALQKASEVVLYLSYLWTQNSK